MPIANQGLFTAIVNHEMDIVGIVAHKLACSGSGVIMESSIYASFLCYSFPEAATTFKPRFYNGGIRAKTSYKLDLNRNVYCIEVNQGLLIVARESIIIGAAPPVPTTFSRRVSRRCGIHEMYKAHPRALVRRASPSFRCHRFRIVLFRLSQKERYYLGKFGLTHLSSSNCLVPS